MKPVTQTALAVALGTFAVLGTQVTSYGLVYPAGSAHSKLGLVIAWVAGALLALISALMAARALRHTKPHAARFVALLGAALCGFFLLVVVFGFAIPDLLLGPKD